MHDPEAVVQRVLDFGQKGVVEAAVGFHQVHVRAVSVVLMPQMCRS